MSTNRSAMGLLTQLSKQRFQDLTPVIAYLSILTIIGITGNLLVIVIYAKRPSKTSSSYFILCLSIFDLITCTLIPFDIVDIIFIYNFGYPWVCKLLRFVTYFSIMASISVLVIIAFDRYYKVCKPARRHKHNRLKILTSLPIILGLLFSWPAAIVFGDSQLYLPQHNITASQCSFDANVNYVYPKIYYAILGTMFFGCTIALIVLYARILRHVHQHEKVVRKISNSSVNSETETGGRKSINSERISIIFFLISVVFFLSYLPMLILLTLRSLIKNFEQFDSYSADISYEIFIRFYFINNVANPIIYSFLNRQFRRELWDIVKTARDKIHDCDRSCRGYCLRKVRKPKRCVVV